MIGKRIHDSTKTVSAIDNIRRLLNNKARKKKELDEFLVSRDRDKVTNERGAK